MTSTPMEPTRRTLLQLTAGAVAAPYLIGGARAATQITVADPGGPFGPAFRKAFYDPFEKATGNKVVNVAREAEPTAQFKAMVETKSYTWDVCTLTLSARDILKAQGLLDPIGFAHADVPKLMPQAISPEFMGTDVYSTIFAYRTDRVKNAPASWADFFNVEKFPGRRALRKNPIDTLEQALLADGVPLDKLYPLDVDRAFKVLDKIKIVPFPVKAQPGSPIGWNSYPILKSTQNREAAWALSKFYASPAAAEFLQFQTAAQRSIAKSDAYLNAGPEGIGFLYDALDFATPVPGPDQGSIIQQDIEDTFAQILIGNLEPEAGLNDLNAKIQSNLA